MSFRVENRRHTAVQEIGMKVWGRVLHPGDQITVKAGGMDYFSGAVVGIQRIQETASYPAFHYVTIELATGTRHILNSRIWKLV